jgi:hypothetical protein
LEKLGLQLFVDQQQRLQRTPYIAVAPGDDFVDRRVTWSGSHRNPPIFHKETILRRPMRCCELRGKAGQSKQSGNLAAGSQNCGICL